MAGVVIMSHMYGMCGMCGMYDKYDRFWHVWSKFVWYVWFVNQSKACMVDMVCMVGFGMYGTVIMVVRARGVGRVMVQTVVRSFTVVHKHDIKACA